MNAEDKLYYRHKYSSYPLAVIKATKSPYGPGEPCDECKNPLGTEQYIIACSRENKLVCARCAEGVTTQ